MKAKKNQKIKLRKIMGGIVTNIIDEKTFKVRVERKFPHPKYGKIIKKHKNYIVHNEKNEKLEKGELVTIGEITPISKRKVWGLINKQKSK